MALVERRVLWNLVSLSTRRLLLSFYGGHFAKDEDKAA